MHLDDGVSPAEVAGQQGQDLLVVGRVPQPVAQQPGQRGGPPRERFVRGCGGPDWYHGAPQQQEQAGAPQGEERPETAADSPPGQAAFSLETVMELVEADGCGEAVDQPPGEPQVSLSANPIVGEDEGIGHQQEAPPAGGPASIAS